MSLFFLTVRENQQHAAPDEMRQLHVQFYRWLE